MDTLVKEPLAAEWPIQFHLSFRPFVNYLREQRRSAASATIDQLYAYLIDQFEDAATLTDQPVAVRSSARLHEYFRLATVVIMPLVCANEDIPYAFGLPIPLRFYHSSPAFERLMRHIPDLMDIPQQSVTTIDKERFLYRQILEKCYSVQFAAENGPSFQFQGEQNKLTKYYRMDVNMSFVEPHSLHELPPLQQAWVEFAEQGTSLPEDIEPLPLNEFAFAGFSFFRVEDITESESMQQLREVFVHLPSAAEPALYNQFEAALRNFCGLPSLEVGVMPLHKVNGNLVYLPDNQVRSVFLRLSEIQFDDEFEPDTQELMDRMLQHPQPTIFPELEGIPDPERQLLARKGIRSFLVYPVLLGSEVLGFLEMGSPQPDAFTLVVLDKITQVLPMIQELLNYQSKQFNDQIKHIIKARFTPLQPAVEWKFNEAAWQELRRGQSISGEEPAPVQFPQVYPFYGAIDVRGSSTERQKAIRQDLYDQLTDVEELLYQVRDRTDSYQLSWLIQNCYEWQTKLAVNMTPDQEHGVTAFLLTTVNPFFRQLLTEAVDLHPVLLRYFDRINAKTGQFNQAQLAYEQTMEQLNTAINTYIDRQEAQLQTIFPHYFERYRTDGAEYTLYVGQSIAPEQPFGLEICRRLYQWQLRSMVEVAQLTHRLLPQLPLPLQTTQLILLHAHPVDISFRHDERRFDVDGLYSIHYEVVKKRIDKACIQGTHERLTQPGTIALVYSRSAEVHHYLPFIAELQAEGKLLPGAEYFDLEPVQGVAELKALRVRVADLE